MTVKQYIKKYGWNIECDIYLCRWICVDIAFINSEGNLDETSFDIRAYDYEELAALFRNFCEENNFSYKTVCNIRVTATAEMYEKLEEIS